ncbi:hypothetical protein Cgig2_015642 [Carnegiea gigantea]|uniref:Ubiquitin-like protease family profile domain-containing protein n=1 Tax=Carnegiea gigantea TaxID=171969 RepID=A0A9Q1QB64_9CARY|nr:hypothetical protein Cgig2_015642 [Carnegiea gigantea]
MALLETSDGHWLLLVTDLRERSFIVYDSLPSPAAKSRRELVDSAVSRLVTLLFAVFHSGHDCRVFVMALMDLLSLKAYGFEFDQDCVAHYRQVPKSKWGQVPTELSAGSGNSFPATSTRFISNFSNLMTYPKSSTLPGLVTLEPGEIVTCLKSDYVFWGLT